MTDERKLILIIEDNNAMLQLYAQVFTSSGFRVVTASDGQSGWMKAQEEHPDLILLDMVLPKISGVDLLQRLRQDTSTSGIPVVVFSAVNNAEGIRQAMEAGANEFLPKATSSPKQVISKIQTILEKTPVATAAPRLCPHCHKPI